MYRSISHSLHLCYPPLLLTVCVIVNVNLFYNAFQLWGRLVVCEYSDACGVAAELLAAFEFSSREHTGKHACEDGKGGWAACKTLKSDLGF